MDTDTNTQETQSVTLYNRTPGRDAVYILELKRAGDLWQVFYSNGRRGATLTTKPVTQPVAYDVALKAFNDKKKSKLAGGYHPPEYFGEGEATANHIATADDERETGIFPQLLTEADEREAVAFIEDGEWGMQEKFDGKRIIIDAAGGIVRAINRKGLTCGISRSIHTAIIVLAAEIGDFRFDGEAVGDALVIFDCLSLSGRDLTAEPYADRFAAARDALAGFNVGGVRVAELWTTTVEKSVNFARIKAEGKEGVVFKRLSAPYRAGRPNSGGDQRKVKFTFTVTVVVDKVNAKRSFSMVVYENGEPRTVGNCTVPANRELPSERQFIEVRYLYAFRGGSLFQPRYVARRDDLTLDDVMRQPALKYKAEGEEA